MFGDLYGSGVISVGKPVAEKVEQIDPGEFLKSDPGKDDIGHADDVETTLQRIDTSKLKEEVKSEESEVPELSS